MAKLLKLRRGTTSQHSSFTGAEGEVTIDTDKEVPVVHDGSTAGGHPVAAEDMANVSSASIAGRLGTDSIAVGKIAAGALPTDVTVTNSNVVSNAAIVGTKVDPDFGSQTIETTGGCSIGQNIVVGGTVDGRDVAADGSKLDGIESGATADQSASEILTALLTVDGNSSGIVAQQAGKIDIGGITTNASKQVIFSSNNAGTARDLAVDSTDSKFTYNPSSNTLDVDNITCSGTVDGRDVSADGSKLDGIAAGATNVSNNNQLTNGAGYYASGSSPSFVDTYTSSWFRNDGAGEGLYNSSTQQHWYSADANYWSFDGNGTYGGIQCRDDGASTIRGYFYFNNSNSIGILDQGGNWRIQVESSTRTRSYNHFTPGSNNTFDLGESGLRWRNVYTNDLHLSNEGGNNDVDGSWGSFTIQEGEDDLFLLNKRNGKKYKFNLTEVS